MSLEAIFLSTFVMISQNRADEKRQVIAKQQWRTVQEEEQQNETLLCLSNEILGLTKEIDTATRAAAAVPAVEFGGPSPSYGAAPVPSGPQPASTATR